MTKIHFIAIGGSAMHNLAIALHNKGYMVSGSDDVIFEPARARLFKYGLLPEVEGWFPEKITTEIEAVILGMHAQSDNPELKKAIALGLKIYSYPEYLYEQCKDKTRIVIGGSHGKTTITSMILHVAHYHNRDVDYMVGAQLEGFDTMVHLTPDNEFIILEGDEYLSSTLDSRPKFHLYQPNIALISGIAWDHINVFPTFQDYLEQFSIFIDKIVPGGAIIYNEEDENVKKLIELKASLIKKFPYKKPVYLIQDEQTFLQTFEGLIPLQVFGDHNLTNIEGARLVCNQIGIGDELFYEAIQSFKGASKRLETWVSKPSYTVFKDFAHSPSKVEATTKAVKNQFSTKTLVACLELHTYSSLNLAFINQYKHSLSTSDIPVVYYNDEALKIKKMPPLDLEIIKKAFDDDRLQIFSSSEELASFLTDIQKEDRIFLMMSSGNYGGIDISAIF